MILNPAESICGTGVGNSAGIEMLSVDTGGVGIQSYLCILVPVLLHCQEQLKHV